MTRLNSKAYIVSFLYKFFPDFLIDPILHSYTQWKSTVNIKRKKRKQKQAIGKLNSKRPIRCVFLALYDYIWKCDSLYQKMEVDERFEPIILVCPIVNKGREHMLEEMDRQYQSFKEKGYNVLRSYNSLENKYIDVKESLSPDILVYTNPYKGLIDDRYYIDHYEDVLTIYIPYYINGTVNNDMAYNMPVHNYSWRYYVESESHLRLAEKYSSAKGRNVVVSGYPGIEEFIDGRVSKVEYKKWKSNSDKRKRIIWAPHQTIEAVGHVHYSCFMLYYGYMIEIADKYADTIQIIFKPHPLLKGNLYKIWGKEKTNKYYYQWEERENTAIEYGDYHNLFITSDALIHDCGSFTTEYLYLNKPVLRTMNGVPLETMFGSFGLKCIDCHYKAYNEQDIEQFIQNVINGVDPMKEQRTKFVKDELMPKGGMPSENIINDIIDSIEHQRV